MLTIYVVLAGYQTCLSGKMHFVGPDQLHGFEERLTTDIYPPDFGWTPDYRKPALHIHMIPMSREKKFWDLYENCEHLMPTIGHIAYEQHDPHSQRILDANDRENYNITDEKIKRARRAYFANISYLDDKIGEILKTLEDTRQEATILFVSDHGDMLGERGLWFKMSFYDGSSRVPIMISSPEMETGLVTQPVSNIDICPTLCELAGANMNDIMQWTEGESLVPLGQDPHELNNLASNPAYSQVAAEFRAQATKRWNLEQFDSDVRHSQASRWIVYEALRNGKYFPWDYQPLQKASERYMRNHMDLNVLEENQRFPRATGEVIAKVHSATPAIIEQAINSAQSAQKKWAATSNADRGRILRKAAAIIRERNRDLSILESYDTGKPLQETLVADATSGADSLEYFGGLAATLTGEHIPLGESWAYTKFISRQVYQLVYLTSFKASANVGAELVNDRRIDKVSLTGSVPTGKKVYANAASQIKHVTMEVGKPSEDCTKLCCKRHQRRSNTFYGGNRIERDGFFLEPTIFCDVKDDMVIAREEIFGPVMCVLDFDDEVNVIARANDTEFGLAAGIFTNDLTRAHRVISKLEAGTCWINAYN
ncbi:Choline-sulfatase [Nymphon striatum]|nr:Choline-sulfatase [Nymphon striatum]